MAKRTKTGEMKARCLDFLATCDEWVSGAEVGEALGIAATTARGHLCRLVSDGKVESRTANHGGGYRLRRDKDTHREGEPEAGQEARTASRPPAPRAQDHETAPSPQAAPAPEGSPEQPADEAAEVPSVPSPPAADTILGLPVVEDLELHVAPDLELYVLQLLADLDPEARERVLQFAVAKWWLT